jgi:hypothetical protein
MRIVTRALCVAAGGYLLALFLQLTLALPGALSDRDSVVGPTTIHS